MINCIWVCWKTKESSGGGYQKKYKEIDLGFKDEGNYEFKAPFESD